MDNPAEKPLKSTALSTLLKKELPIHGARINFLVLLITSLLKVQTINFNRLAQGMEQAVQPASNLRRIHRFFAHFALDGDLVARLLFKLLPFAGPYKLSLDRTNWQYGSKKINILVLGVTFQGVAIPILWSFLGDKKGNSSQVERMRLLQRFIDLFGVEQIDCLYADREFIGGKWWAFLRQQGINYYIRIRHNQQVERQGIKVAKISTLFHHLEVGVTWHRPRAVCIEGVWLYVTAKKIALQRGKWEWLIVATNVQTTDALAHYGRRWQIETMFKCLKTKGFQLESTHVRDDVRLNRLLSVVALAFVWAYKAGLYRAKHIQERQIKKHGRPAHSWFSFGLQWLGNIFMHPNNDQHRALAWRIFLSGT